MGKKPTQDSYSSDILQDETKSLSAGEENKLLKPAPLLFRLDEQAFELYSYSVRMASAVNKDHITIIDEKGNRLKPSQSDRIGFGLFSLTILDHDLRDEESLKRSIKFPIEKENQEEYYRGMVDETDEDVKTNLKVPGALIYTN